MLEGLYAVVKSAVSASLKFITMGVSTIVNAVVGVIEAVIRLVYSFKERKFLNQFIAKCREYWKLPRSARILALSGEARGFNQEFLEATENSPIIAAITLNSRIAGDKYRLLQVYSGNGSIITQSQFDAGCTYLNRLGTIGRAYFVG